MRPVPSYRTEINRWVDETQVAAGVRIQKIQLGYRWTMGTIVHVQTTLSRRSPAERIDREREIKTTPLQTKDDWDLNVFNAPCVNNTSQWVENLPYFPMDHSLDSFLKFPRVWETTRYLRGYNVCQ